MSIWSEKAEKPGLKFTESIGSKFILLFKCKEVVKTVNDIDFGYIDEPSLVENPEMGTIVINELKLIGPPLYIRLFLTFQGVSDKDITKSIDSGIPLNKKTVFLDSFYSHS